MYRNHGSVYWAGSARGKGGLSREQTTKMPAVSQAANARLVFEPPRPRDSARRPLSILLVEDHLDTARMMARFLASEGYQVQTACNLAGALRMLEEYQPDLLLSDLGLPDGTGWDLMRTLHARGIDLPAIAVSGYGQEKDIQQSREVGFADHIVKPVQPERLLAAIACLAEMED